MGDDSEDMAAFAVLPRIHFPLSGRSSESVGKTEAWRSLAESDANGRVNSRHMTVSLHLQKTGRRG